MDKGVPSHAPLTVRFFAVVVVTSQVAGPLICKRPTLVLMGAAAVALCMGQPVEITLLDDRAGFRV